jgi:C-terminal processing protease CtpA/Prc
MKRNTVISFAFAIPLLLGATGVFRSQEASAPPALPAPPAMAALPAQEMPFGETSAWLGVSLRDVTAEKARALKLPGEYGALVEDVEEDSPAAKAGLAKGDVILEFAGERVRSAAQLRRLIRETPPDRTVALQISRNGQTQTLNAKLKTREPFNFQPPEIHVEPFQGRNLYIEPFLRDRDFEYRFLTPGPRLGISGEDLTSQLASYFGVKQGKGVLVREVESGSAAEKAGLKAGDVIIRVENTEVSSLESLRRALPRDFEGKKKVNLTIVRERGEQTLSVELEAPEAPLRSLEREITRVREEQLKQMSAEIAHGSADLRKALAEATHESARQAIRYQEEMRRSLQLLERELQKQKLQEIRLGQPRAETI